MRDIEQKISPLIQNMFPSFYKEEGQNFIAFVTAYYEWLETNFQLLELEDTTNFNVNDIVTQQDVTGTITAYVGSDILVKIDGFNTFKCYNVCSELIPITSSSGGSTYIKRGGSSRRLSPLYMARNLPKLRDIDKTLDLFIVEFKEKYLKNIEFDTSTNKVLLVKNSLDLYRSKGTERSIDLFFRLVYGIKASVSYPGERLFQLSASEWYVPSYLEISSESVSRNIELVGKQIEGVTSGATAFVEKYVKRKISSGFIHILYISNIRGEFDKNELLKTDTVYQDSPKVLGSIYKVDIVSGGSGYSIGDIISFTSSSGERGLARVSKIRDTSGTVDFELIDGGWGYTVSSIEGSIYPESEKSQVLVSERLLSLEDVRAGNTVSSISLVSSGSNYTGTDTVRIVSPTVNATARIVTGGGGAITDVILTNPGNGLFTETPTIEIVNQSGAPSGGSGAQFTLTFDKPTEYFRLLDTVQQNNTTGTLVHFDKAGTIELNTLSQVLVENDELYQVGSFGETASAVVREVVSSSLVSTIVRVDNITGVFDSTKQIFVRNKETTALFSKLNLNISIAESVNGYSSGTIYTKYSGTSANVVSVSTGTNAKFEIGSIKNTDIAYLNTDKLNANNTFDKSFLSLKINEFSLGFKKNPLANKNTVLFSALTFDPYELGTIATLSNINPGTDYSTDPQILAYQPFLVGYDFNDYIMNIQNITGNFKIGSVIEQKYNENWIQLELASTPTFSIGEKIRINGFSSVAIIQDIDLSSNTIIVSNSISPISAGDIVNSFLSPEVSIEILTSTTFAQEIVARAIVKTYSQNTILAKRIQFKNKFKLGLPINVVGENASATLVSITEDESTLPIGINANLSAAADSIEGSISEVKVIDSGLGYKDGQDLIFRSETNTTTGTAKAYTKSIGSGSGYYKTSKGFLSSISKLYDGDYYQEYSYDILSRIPLDKYAIMFKKVMHTAGTRFFGSILIDSVLHNKITIVDSSYVSEDGSPYSVSDRFSLNIENRSNLDISIRG